MEYQTKYGRIDWRSEAQKKVERREERIQRAFDYACKQASNCRHDKCIVSCFGCNEYKTCDIQRRVNKNKFLLHPDWSKE